MSELIGRILKRERHSSRAPLSVAAAMVIGLLAVYGLLEAVLRAVGQRPWLIDPLTAARRLARLPEGISPVLLGAIGVLLALLGLVCLGHAFLPGRRARHTIADPRLAIVVDDEVIASALARRARLAAGVTREQVIVVVSTKAVQVNVRPTSGIPLDESHIRAAVEDELEQMALEPAPDVTVNLSGSGVIGV
ncbi:MULTISPECIES: DUF6286 domain-containing protein [unclassified Arthrobacter]|uniref:DUF6286 domain-containing protein n=1 Tax=unclassified Arthrobacter TaxID=235627 RepID=UPI00159D8016|nr:MULTISPECIES: DUF6286 domain-containing protein [unclassified Arthrobacter]MCQ9162643.1 DUF6286 domain-containing protein [Arthrobacter sp. STN4]NVM97374.1 hypothetical protein [Arthrobacter sp. SDTb3-6]